MAMEIIRLTRGIGVIKYFNIRSRLYLIAMWIISTLQGGKQEEFLGLGSEQ